VESLKKEGILAEADLRNEKISYKIREHSSKKVPIILAIGNNEKKDRTVSIRRIGSTDTEVVDLKVAIKQIAKENTALN
jgi:threonyl-tRNA synthetase